MPRPKTKPEAFTIGQLAQHWAVGKDRVQSLVLAGRIPGAFTIPSSGRYGETVKIPLALSYWSSRNGRSLPRRAATWNADSGVSGTAIPRN